MSIKPTFQTAQQFLADRIQLGAMIKRVGVAINTKFGELGNNQRVSERLHAIIDSVFDTVQSAIDDKLSAISDESEQIAVQFIYAQSRKIAENDQLAMLMRGKSSSMVSHAAANQRHVPVAVQFALLETCGEHVSTMRTLLTKTNLHPNVVGTLATHPSSEVRLDVAKHIGMRMKIAENLTNEKQNAYNAIVDAYEADYADYLIPVCKRADQIQQMFDETPMVPSKVRLFVDNPYTPDRVLLDIISSTVTKLMPGGSDVIEDARKVIENRIVHRKIPNDVVLGF